MAGCAGKLTWCPKTVWKRLVCDGRPDVQSKTRAPQWRLLQGEGRFLQALLCYVGPPAFVLHKIKWPLLFNLVIGTLVTIDQSLDFYHTDKSMLPNLDELVTTSWRMTSFVMALLLAFRVNRTYDRWWMARQAFAGVGNAGLSLSQQAMTCIRDPAIRDEVRRWSKIWHYSIMHVCSFSKAGIHPDGAALMSSEELALYSSSRKGRNLVVNNLRQLIASAGLDTAERIAMETTLQAGITSAGTCTRLAFQAMPHSLTLMMTGFLQIFLMFMPCGLVRATRSKGPTEDDPPIFGFILYLFTCILLLGVDEVTTQLEQPFPSIPMLEIVDTTVRDIDRLPQEYAALDALREQALQQRRKALISGSSDGGVHDDVGSTAGRNVITVLTAV